MNEEQLWLEQDRGEYSKGEYKGRMDSFNTFVQPYMSKLYSGETDMNNNPMDMPAEESAPTEPTIDEVD